MGEDGAGGAAGLGGAARARAEQGSEGVGGDTRQTVPVHGEHEVQVGADGTVRSGRHEFMEGDGQRIGGLHDGLAACQGVEDGSIARGERARKC